MQVFEVLFTFKFLILFSFTQECKFVLALQKLAILAMNEASSLWFNYPAPCEWEKGCLWRQEVVPKVA